MTITPRAQFFLAAAPIAGVIGLMVIVNRQFAPFITDPTARSQATLLTLLVGIFGLCIVVIIWALLYRALWLPMRCAARNIDMLIHANSGHQLDLPDWHWIGELTDPVNDLGNSLLRARREVAAASVSTNLLLEAQKQQLEAVLLALTEGVLVCTQATVGEEAPHQPHRIQLFNDAAIRLLGIMEVGLGRSLSEILDPAIVDSASELLDARQHSALSCRHVEFIAFGKSNPCLLRWRMAAVSTPAAAPLIILTFDPAPAGSRPTRPHLIEAERLPERPEFYDFAFAADHSRNSQIHNRPLDTLNFVVFDTETTGLQPGNGDKIVQLAGVRIVNSRLLQNDYFDQLINPERAIPPSSTRFHGIIDSDVATAPTIHEVLPRFKRFVGDETVLVAHNAAFDMKFLQLQGFSDGIRFDNPVLDTLLLSVCLHDHAADHTLDGIAQRLDVLVTGRHQALGDSIATAHVFIKLLALLKAQGITTLGAALDASAKTAIARQQNRMF